MFICLNFICSVLIFFNVLEMFWYCCEAPWVVSDMKRAIQMKLPCLPEGPVGTRPHQLLAKRDSPQQRVRSDPFPFLCICIRGQWARLQQLCSVPCSECCCVPCQERRGRLHATPGISPAKNPAFIHCGKREESIMFLMTLAPQQEPPPCSGAVFSETRVMLSGHG